MTNSVTEQGQEGADLRRARRVRTTPMSQADKLPPHSPESEAAALGCAFLDPKAVMPELIERLKAGGEEFYDLRHLTIYEALVKLYDEGTEIDVITVQAYLKKQEMLEQVGGLGYLAALPDAVPSVANVSYYLDFICEKYQLRKTIQVCNSTIDKIYAYEGEADTVLDEAERDLIRLREIRSAENSDDIATLVNKGLQTIENLYNNRGTITGISTGYYDLDRMTSGLQKGEFIIIAARPSMGKTSLAMNMVENIAVEQKLPVGVFSLEMTAEALVLRMMCSRARINIRNVRDGYLQENDFTKLVAASGRIRQAPLYVDDSSGLSIMQLRAKLRRMVTRWGIKIAFVDYLQLLHSTSRKAKNRQEEMADISSGIKGVAKELDIPIVGLAQLNREMEREKRKPRLADLRESGAIEQDADLAALLYKDADDDADANTNSWENREVVPVNLLVAKQRNGPTGEVPLTFIRSYTRFESQSRVEDADIAQGEMSM